MPLTLDMVQLALARTPGAAWQPRDSAVARRLASEQPASEMFGLAATPEETLEAKRTADAADRNFMAVQPPPPRVDWRDFGGCWLSDIRDQGACGACVAFATVASLEARIRINREDPDLAVALSEADLFFCGGCDCRTGWNFEPALDRCEYPGVGRGADFVYTPSNQPCQSSAPIARAPSYKKLSSLNARREALAFGGPVIGGMRVFEDFGYYAGGVYKHVAGEFQGLHAVCVVGYDDHAQCWIVRNSWGRAWGEDGYVRIGYGECGLDVEFVFYAPSVTYQPGGFS